MKLTMVTIGGLLALASSPAMAQLAGSGNLVSTSPSPPTGASSSHQSTTMINGGATQRAVLYGVNGGDLAPNVNTSNLILVPKQTSSQLPKKGVGFYVEAGANKGSLTQNPTLRASVSNNTGAGPSSTFRSVDVNVPSSVSKATGGTGNLTGGNLTGGAGNLAGLGNTAGSGTVKSLTGNVTGNLAK